MTQQNNNGNSGLFQGRILWISGKTIAAGEHQKDDRTKQLKYKPNGEAEIVYGFGLAIPKVNPQTGQHHPEFVKIWQALQAEAMALYPSGHVPQDFAWKYKDGDAAVDKQGQPYSKREGYAGHFVITCTTQIPLKQFVFQGGNNILVNEGIKAGDYVDVQLNIKGHHAVGNGKPGLYLNPSAVRLIQQGKEIINTPSGDQIFGQNMPSYQGEMQAPSAGAMPNMGAPAGMPGGMPGGQMPGGMPPANNQYQAPPANNQYQAPPPAAAPNYGVLPPQHQPGGQMPGGMPPANNGYNAPPANGGMPGMPPVR